MKRLLQQCASSLLAFVMLFTASAFPIPPSLAADDSINFVQVQMAVTNDANTNNIANIGDQLTLFVVLNNADGGCVAQSTQVFADLSKYGGSANQALNCNTDNGGAGDQFGFQFLIQDGGGSAIDVPANDAASQITVTATDADENNGAGNPNPTQNTNSLGDGVVDNSPAAATNGVDSDAPQITDAGTLLTPSINPAKIGDTVLATYTPLTDSINDPNPNEIRADLSNLGGLNNQQLFDDGTNGDVTNADGTFSFLLTYTAGTIDAAGLTVGFVMEDDAGNNSGAAVNDSVTITLDNQPPTVTVGNSAAVIQVDNGTPGEANENDVIRITWDNSGGGDNNADTLGTVTADLSAFGGGANQQLFDDGSNGDQTGADDVYTFDYTVLAGAINATNLNATINVTDDAGNLTSTTDDSNLTVNNAAAGSGRRRVNSPVVSEEEEVVVSIPTEDIVSCGCENELKTLNLYSSYLLDSYLTGINSSDVVLINPICLEGDAGTTDKMPETERFLREAIKELKEATQKIQEASKKVTEARKVEQEALGDYGNAHLNYLELINNGKRAGESQSAFEARKKEVTDTRAEKDKAYREKRSEYYEALEARNQAEFEHQQARKKMDEGHEAAKEEFGVKRANEIFQDAFSQKTESIASCVDSTDSGNNNNWFFQSEQKKAHEELNSCLQKCPALGGEPYSAWTTNEVYIRTDLEDSESDPLGISVLEPPGIESFGPFNPLSSGEVLPSSSFFAEDIGGHPSEPFILKLYDEGAVNGVGGGRTYGPNMPTTRAALLKVGYNTFGITVPQLPAVKIFADVDPQEWHGPLFEFGAQRGDVRGYGPENLPLSRREARPAQNINYVEAITFFSRIGEIDLNLAYDYQSDLIDQNDPQWWHQAWNFAEMYGVVSPDTITLDESTDPVSTDTDADGVSDDEEVEPEQEVVKGEEPINEVTRAIMAELAVKMRYVKLKAPCNCDKEKAAWDEAKRKAEDAKAKAEADQAAADKSEAAAKKAEAAAKEAQQALDDLAKYDDDSSSATGEDDVTITTGDLRLMELAKAEIDAQVASGEKSLEEGQKEKEGINKDKLPELRERRDELTAQAREKAIAANKAAQEARSKADADAAKAKKSQEEADKAAEEEAKAKKAYDDCLVKCKIKNQQWAEEQRRLEAERRRRAIEAERRRKAKAEQERKDRERREAEERRRQQQNTPPPSSSSGEGESTGTSGGGGGGGIPGASKDPCKEKFLQAVAARGKQVAEARPDDVEDFDPDLKTPLDVTTGIGELIGAAAQAAAQGGKSAVQIASGLAALPQVIYGFWVDYVGSAALKGGKALLGGRICQAYQVSTTGKCGYEVSDGQVVYWERDAQGNMSVVIMGPGDSVEKQQCPK